MQILSAVAISLLIIKMDSSPAPVSSIPCGKYVFSGKLSSDLKAKPTLLTKAPAGFPIQIELEFQDQKAFEAIVFRGKLVRASVQILRASDKQKYQGRIQSIELRASNPLRNANEEVRFLGPSKCEL